jgi:hypothetical protein
LDQDATKTQLQGQNKKNRSGGEKKLARNNNEEKKHIPRRLASFIVGGRFTNWF